MVERLVCEGEIGGQHIKCVKVFRYSGSHNCSPGVKIKSPFLDDWVAT